MLVIRRLFGTGTNCIAPSGLPLLLCLFPGLAPWAFLSRPCGASFAPETRPKISAVFSRTPARPFSFRAGAARLRILSYETVEADHRRTTPFVVYSGIVFLLFLPQPSFARLFVFAPASRAVRWRNGVRQI